MANTPNFNADELRTEALQPRDAITVTAGYMAVKATDLAEQGVDQVAPRAQIALKTAIEKVTPVVEDANERAQAVVERAHPALEYACAEFVNDYPLRINCAVYEGAEALSTRGVLIDRARRATKVS